MDKIELEIKKIYINFKKIISIIKENDLFYLMYIMLDNGIIMEVTLDQQFNCITEKEVKELKEVNVK